MSDIIIAGTLLLNGNLTCDGDITITGTGLVVPTPDPEDMKTYWSSCSNSFITSNGAGRTITSDYGNITVDGIINGNGEGYDSNNGPGANSALLNNLGFPITGYGATHAGLGSVIMEPGDIYTISEEFYLTNREIDDRYIRLMGMPAIPENVALNIISGPPQLYGVDFYVDGNVLRWDNRAMDHLLVPGDTLRVLYEGNTLPIIPNIKPTYGDHEKPISLGSGSGFYHDPLLIDGENTAGGGAIKLVARSGEITLDGTISVDGDSGIHAGGGSGGSIWAVGWTISGTGTLLSRGGNSTYTYGGGGGGGYISLWHEKENTFNGNLSVEGSKGGMTGKIFQKKIEPIIEEKFTGHTWNIKWWENFGDTTHNNNVLLNSPIGNYDPAGFQSLFSLSGRDILVDMDYSPNSTEPTLFSQSFLLYADENNWVGMARKQDNIFGVYSVNGALSQSAIPFDSTNLTFRINKNDSTFAFQFYDGTSLPQTIYADTIPGLANKRFYIRTEIYKPHETEWMTECLHLTSADVSNKYLTLSGPPSDTTNVAMNLLTGSPQYSGSDFYVLNNQVRWDSSGLVGPLPPLLETLLAQGDGMRVVYPIDMTSISNGISCIFDNLKIFDGAIYNAETKEQNIYVDPDYGSDTSDGRQLTPLKNLFTATAWARRGGNVVLYDGTHSSTEVLRKNLTIMGANGAKAVITTANVQDTTGSGWEINALSFYGSQSVVKNLTINDASVGIVVENTDNFEVSGNSFSNCPYPVRFQKCDPLVTKNFVDGGAITNIAFDFTSCPNTTVYSNVVVNSTIAVYAKDSSGILILSNTFDNDATAIVIDSSSTSIIASNNITSNDLGIQRATDSTMVHSFNNNFYDTNTQYSGPAPDMTANNISSNPMYVSPGVGLDYHLQPTSPDIGTGLSTFDFYYKDLDGASRTDSSTYDIGAYMFIDGGHVPGEEYYVSSKGNDFVNFGGQNNPFRTLDKAMQVADSTVNIDGGHYDTYYLKLKSQNINLNQLTVYIEEQDHFLSYYTLSYEDIKGKYVKLPGILKSGDYTNIAVNVVSGPAQMYGPDYISEAGAIGWKGLALDGLLEIGDILRVTYDGVIGPKASDTLTLSSHFSNYDQEKAVFVSPNGSDSSIMGGDGTNTGGNGTMALPYRTVSKALQDSSVGSNIVLMAGEYPVFAGVDQRIIVPAMDRTGIPEKGLSRQYVEDLFNPRDFRGFGPIETDPEYWALNYSGNSYASIGGGFMALTYDGTNPASATSLFTVTNDFEVSAELRSAIDPIFFNISGVDQTMSFTYNDGSYVAGAYTGGIHYYCWGTVYPGVLVPEQMVVEYLTVTSTNVNDKFIQLSFIPEVADSSSIAVNTIGGVAQTLGEDFYINDGKIKWDGLGMDGEVQPGDTLRIIYMDRRISDPVLVSMSLIGNRYTIKIFDGTWRTVFKRDMVGSYQGPWDVSFFMNKSNPVSHNCSYGKGFVSKFLAVGETIGGVSAEPFLAKTERRTVVIYKE